MSKINGATVYFFGAASGIGLETAQLLAQKGAHLALIDRQPLEDVQAKIMAACVSQAQQVTSASVDVTDLGGVEALINDLATTWRAPDIVITSAGVPGGFAFESMTPEQFDKVIKVNLYGAYHVARAARPWLEQSKGHLMIVASLAGIASSYGYTSYGASKAGTIGFCEALRIEMKPKGVRISVFCPPEVITPLVDEERKTMPEEGKFLKTYAGQITLPHAAKAIVQGLERNSFMIVPGFLANLLLLQLRLTPKAFVNWVTDLQVKSVQKTKVEK